MKIPESFLRGCAIGLSVGLLIVVVLLSALREDLLHEQAVSKPEEPQHEQATKPVHKHTHPEKIGHVHTHERYDWERLNQLAEEVLRQKEHVTTHIGAMDNLTGTFNTMQRQCKAFEAWKTEQVKALGRIENGLTGTRLFVGANICEDEADCLRGSSTLKTQVAEVHHILKKEPWTQLPQVLQLRLAACGRNFGDARQLAAAIDRATSAIEATARPRLGGLNQLEGEPNTLELRFSPGQDEGVAKCDDTFSGFAILDRNGGESCGPDEQAIHRTLENFERHVNGGSRLECRAHLRLPAPSNCFDIQSVTVYRISASDHWERPGD